MTSANRSVPFPLKPWAEERLAHYLARVTTHNGYLAVSWLLESAGLLNSGQTFNTALRRALHDPEAAKPLALLLSVDAKVIDEMRLRNAKGTKKSGLVKLGGFFISRDHLVQLRRRYCPACETEGDRDASLIDVAYYLACSEHHCRIVDACRCGQPLDWNTGVIPFCLACGDSQTDAIEPADPDLISLAQHFADLHNGLIPSTTSAYHDLSSLIGLLQDVSGALNIGSSLGRFEYGAERLGYGKLAEHARFSWKWIQSEESFKSEFLSWIEHRRRMWPELPIRGWFVDIQRVLDGITDVKSRDVLQKWLANAILAIADAQDAKVGSVSCEDAWVTARWAAWILGTSDHNVRRLIKSKRLPSKFAFEGRKRSDRLVALRDLNRFCKDLRAVATDQRGEDWSRFSDAIRTFDRVGRGYGIDAALSDLLDGRLNGCWILGTGLEGLYVEPVRQISERNSPDKNNGSILSIAQSAAELGIYQDALYRLIKANLLVPDTRHIRGQERYSLSRMQLQSFRDTYVFAGELARHWGVGRTSLTDRLIDQGVMPISGPRIDGGLVYLFRRSDAECIDPATVQRDAPYRSRAGRRSNGARQKNMISSAEVCTRLKITSQALGSLVKRGYLVEASESHFEGNRRFFDVAHLDAYAARFKENPLLIELDEAARLLTCTRRVFLTRYVLTGLIKPTNDGTDRQYIGREALDSILRGDMDLLPLSSAAEKLGVPKMRLKNLRTTGRIKTQVRRISDHDVHYYSLVECRKALESQRSRRSLISGALRQSPR